MANRFFSSLLFCAGLAAISAGSPPAFAGDEDVKAAPAPQAEAPVPEDTALPAAPEGEAPALQEEPPPPAAPAFEPTVTKKRSSRSVNWPYDADRNIDYSELISTVDTDNPGSEVLPPALGFRGYRPNMVALGVGDRTPGVGAFVEYNWNRVGVGAFYSFRKNASQSTAPAAGQTSIGLSQAFFGVYGLYRWLPWSVSPYFLLGAEAGYHTQDALGGLLGLGIEAQVYEGFTFLVGYSYHSTAHDGFFGGSIGWSF